jgi:hypothetical protein
MAVRLMMIALMWMTTTLRNMTQNPGQRLKDASEKSSVHSYGAINYALCCQRLYEECNAKFKDIVKS